MQFHLASRAGIDGLTNGMDRQQTSYYDELSNFLASLLLLLLLLLLSPHQIHFIHITYTTSQQPFRNSALKRTKSVSKLDRKRSNFEVPVNSTISCIVLGFKVYTVVVVVVVVDDDDLCALMFV
ncbi:conserved hypothetical protein [Trichinella spiralis]|uniref:hypothetical protein n=1 Tax=Trichinella spiralis TaxID=6334 RepID=UPI0001EFBF0D|nr:conserved hypothetical protein [Trichinella spiralis]